MVPDWLWSGVWYFHVKTIVNTTDTATDTAPVDIATTSMILTAGEECAIASYIANIYMTLHGMCKLTSSLHYMYLPPSLSDTTAWILEWFFKIKIPFLYLSYQMGKVEEKFDSDREYIESCFPKVH